MWAKICDFRENLRLNEEFVNPNNLSYVELFKSWSGMSVFDNKESVTNRFESYSDESMMRALISKWKRKNDEMLRHVVPLHNLTSSLDPIRSKTTFFRLKNHEFYVI